MRKLVTVLVISSLLFALVPAAALAGDRYAAKNVWAGAAIGAGAFVLGGLLLDALFRPIPVVAAPPVVAALPPPVVYSAPPPAVYAPPPVIVYPAQPPVVSAPAPVVVYRGWGPPGHWKKWQRGHGKHAWH